MAELEERDPTSRTAEPLLRRSGSGWVVLAIFLLALAVRAIYFLGAEVEVPIRGDILENWNYAWNLVHHGVYSHADPGATVPAPDSYRGPGYPLFLAFCMRLSESSEGAVRVAQWLQLLLGAACAPLTVVLARRWLANPWALLAGVLVALWPHMVVFASTLLSETILSLALLTAVLSWDLAIPRPRAVGAAAAGLTAGAVWLVNPLVTFLPPILALYSWWRGMTRNALVYLLAFALVCGAWYWRNSSVDDHAVRGRIGMTFVQGSWPLFLEAHNDRHWNEIAAAYDAQVVEETAQLQAQPGRTLVAIAARMGHSPGEYLRWYVLQKPWLLWSWRIRVGWGDVYFLETRYSPFERNAGLRVVRAAFVVLNPMLFGAALLAALAAIRQAIRRRDEPPSALFACAALFLYVTGVHVLLLAEPRYAVAYRPFQVLLAVSAMAWLVGKLRPPRKAAT